MGDFYYVCKCCGKPIKSNDVCIMKHVRHGKILGKVTGHYNDYGGVTEERGKENAFRGENDNDINSHFEICKSEFEMDDSLKSCPDRIVDGKRMFFSSFGINKQFDCMDKTIVFTDERDINLRNIWNTNKDNFLKACYDVFQTYPLAVENPASGIIAYHKDCYDKATKEEKDNYTPSAQYND